MFNFWNINLKKTYKKSNAHYATLPSRNKPYKINHILHYNANFPKKLNAPRKPPEQQSITVISYSVIPLCFPGTRFPGKSRPAGRLQLFRRINHRPHCGPKRHARFAFFAYVYLFPVVPDPAGFFRKSARIYNNGLAIIALFFMLTKRRRPTMRDEWWPLEVSIFWRFWFDDFFSGRSVAAARWHCSFSCFVRVGRLCGKMRCCNDWALAFAEPVGEIFLCFN